MYYAEKIINGVLMCRHMPDGDWKQVSITSMSKRIIDQKEEINRLAKLLHDAGIEQ